MSDSRHHRVIDYAIVEGSTNAELAAAVQAQIAIDPEWQPWGAPFVHSHGGTDFFHQAMVLYGPTQGTL